MTTYTIFSQARAQRKGQTGACGHMHLSPAELLGCESDGIPMAIENHRLRYLSIGEYSQWQYPQSRC